MNLFIKQTYRLKRTNLIVAREGGWEEEIVGEFGMDMYTLLYLKWITNKDLLYITHGNLLIGMWEPGWERSLEENGYLYMYG